MENYPISDENANNNGYMLLEDKLDNNEFQGLDDAFIEKNDNK